MMMMLFSRLLIAIIWVLAGFVSGQPPATLPADEVESLRVIANTLGKNDWDFSVDPCSGLSGWVSTQYPTQYPVDMNYENAYTCDCTFQNMCHVVTRNTDKGYGNALTCDCTFLNNTTCHVVSIILKAQNLTGSVPRDLIRLPFLQEIDLTRNYLNGTIPQEWGSMNLVNISLIGNRVSGSIPTQLANISTLTKLKLDYNQLSGTIPPEFGNLSRIEILTLVSNNLTGELPATLERLSTLIDIRISDNNFRGSIPNFIQSWRNIEKLRISDLSGNDSNFPNLSNIRGLRILILRSCNIVGELPPYFGGMNQEKKLKVLDLSFNKLSGPIPASVNGLEATDYIYLTGNSLSGPLPDWILNDAENVDLSYNNFTLPNSEVCQPRKVNLFASSKGNSHGIVSCLPTTSCDQENYSLHINCGGRQVVDSKGTIYEDDYEAGGPSNYVRGQTNWGFSSTGHFLDNNQPSDSYVWKNSSVISGDNPQLYADARLSPLSLSYYGFCLRNRNYTVNLHFAEIFFTDDGTYSSVGRRLFDVYIQGKRVLKDFNIASEAGGVNKGIRKNFTAVVSDGTLDIRFYWAGKGTDGIPFKGVYGPLISAISVDSDYKPPPEKGDGRISTGAVAGIVLGVAFTFLLVLGVLWWKGCLRHKDEVHNDLKGLEGSFSLRQIRSATNNFDLANKIGEGGFGPVYKGVLSDGTVIAVKQLSAKSKQGNREFVNEIGMITALQHPHLVKLYGCCIEGNQLLLIYEYMENNSLARALFGRQEHQIHLDWPTRHKICIGMARGLTFLHEESRLKIVHRDIKATNVLLDKKLVPKISDFGLARLDEEDNTHISTRIAGTFGYMAPEYAMRGHLTDKADVYSFGVVLLEVVSGRINTSKYKGDTFNLLDWANALKEEGKLMELVDPRLGSDFNEEEVMTAIHLGLLCTNAAAAERPNMSSVVSILEGRAGLQEFFVSDSNVSVDKIKKETDDQSGVSMDVPWTATSAASTSASDLYPIALDTDYWNKRDQ